ncbi:MAG TPA: TonB-dependent receptor [Pyrinomonadaceae bacterium]|nr:TonB-dependent receptor [Pyrinomonadaceae bacterium]
MNRNQCSHARQVSFLLINLILAVAFNAYATPSYAQSTSARLSGQVMDQNGAVVPGATVLIVNPSTGFSRESTTNDEGIYAFPSLAAGTYVITVRREGFAPVETTDVVLNVGDQKSLKIELSAGDVNAQVQVTTDAPLINESPSVGTVVDRQFVENIPLNGRSFQSLISLTPGVVAVPAGNAGSGQFSVNGQRANANGFYVDGVSANIGTGTLLQPGAQTSGSLPGLTAFGTTQSLVSVDALQEFKVETSSYAAEYGRQPGGQISMVTRSGTNSFHGSAFDYIRNEIFDANNWFANRSGQARPPMRQNNFGGTFAGPVVFPGYNGRNRTFFFLSYEGLILRQPQFILVNVPSLAMRQSAPASIQPILRAFPLPNGRDLPNGLSELSASYSNPSSLNATSIRVDHSLGSRWTLFGRYSHAPSKSSTRTANNLATFSVSEVNTRTATLGLTGAVTPSFTNDFRINFSKNAGTSILEQDNYGGAEPIQISALVPSQYASSPTLQGSLILNFTGRTGSGTPLVNIISPFTFDQRQLNIVNNSSYVLNSHEFKAGVDYRRLTPTLALNDYALQVIFANQAQVLSGVAGSGNVVTQGKADPVFTNYSAYVQDTWKTSRRLTLNLGLRWDVNPPPTDAGGRHLLAVDQIDDLRTMNLAPVGTALWKTTYGNFAPRFGAAYALREDLGWETILRGGFGLFYDTGNTQGANGFNGYPFGTVRVVSNITYPLSGTQLAPIPLPDTNNLPPPSSSSSLFTQIGVFDPNLQQPYTWQWNFAVAQSLGPSHALTVSYVGAAGRRLLQQSQYTLTAINPRFTSVRLTKNNATSDYNALQAQFQRRLSQGLQFMFSYTWSHALDEDSVDNGTIIPVRGNAAFDRRHLFASALTYDIPSPFEERAAKAILGKWSIDSTIHAQSAAPVDIIGAQVTNPADGTLVGNRPNLIAGVPLYIYDSSLPGGFAVNRAAFSLAPAGTFGNLGRNVVRGFPAWQADLALRRQFRITERFNLQFRAEAFNVFNTPNFGAVQTTLTAANFGQATNTLNQQLGGISQLYQLGGPRSLQFAIKVLF